MVRQKLTDEQVEEMMLPKIVEAIYPVFIPFEQQDCRIQAENHAKLTAIARNAWRSFTAKDHSVSEPSS